MNNMTDYSVLFAVKMSAKNVKQLEKKAEKLGKKLSEYAHKPILPYQYGELVKKDEVQKTLTEEEVK